LPPGRGILAKGDAHNRSPPSLDKLIRHTRACRTAQVCAASTPTLFLLAVLGFVDVITGASLSIRPQQREIVLEGPDQTPV
jgi:hypothetical protein